MTIPGSRLDFEESWLKLYEMPEGISGMNLYDTLVKSIDDRINEYGYKVIDCGNNLFKIVGSQLSYYWMGNYDIIAELTITQHNATVNAVAKKIPGSKPHASDFYIAILNDVPSLRFQSDTRLTQDGLKIWKRLLKQGYAISVYNKESPGRSFTPLKTEQDLMQFFKDNDRTYQKYQYVLSEQGLKLGDVHGFFNTRRMRELTGNL